MTGKRLYSISILRVLAMLLVVYYHCICPYYIWSSGVDCAEVTVPLYTKLSLGLLKVHLPIFFIAAGYLFGYKRFRGGYADQRQFLLDKALRVLVPYLTVGLLLIALRQGNLYGLVVGTCSHLWFLVTIFECYAVGKLIDFTLWERRHIQGAAFLTSAVCMVLSYYAFALGSTFPRYFFFYFGGMLIATVDLGRLRKWRGLFAAVAVVSLATMVIEAAFCEQSRLSYPCSEAFVFSLFLVIRMSRIADVPRWLKSLDACSMGIYIVHHIVIQAVNRTDLLHPVLQTHYYVYPAIQFVLVLLFSWSVVHILRRYAVAKYFGL